MMNLFWFSKTEAAQPCEKSGLDVVGGPALMRLPLFIGHGIEGFYLPINPKISLVDFLYFEINLSGKKENIIGKGEIHEKNYQRCTGKDTF